MVSMLPSPDEHLNMIVESEHHFVISAELIPILHRSDASKMPKLRDSIIKCIVPVNGELGRLKVWGSVQFMMFDSILSENDLTALMVDIILLWNRNPWGKRQVIDESVDQTDDSAPE